MITNLGTYVFFFSTWSFHGWHNFYIKVDIYVIFPICMTVSLLLSICSEKQSNELLNDTFD